MRSEPAPCTLNPVPCTGSLTSTFLVLGRKTPRTKGHFRGTPLIRPPLGPYRRPMPSSLCLGFQRYPAHQGPFQGYSAHTKLPSPSLQGYLAHHEPPPPQGPPLGPRHGPIAGSWGGGFVRARYPCTACRCRPPPGRFCRVIYRGYSNSRTHTTPRVVLCS